MARSLRSWSASHAGLCPNAFGVSVIQPTGSRLAKERSGSLAPFRCSKSAADHLYLRSKDEKRGFGFQSQFKDIPGTVFSSSQASLCEGNVAIILSSHWCCCRSLPLGVRVGRYVFVLDDWEDMDITHFLQVVRSEVSVTAESSIWRMPKRRGDWCDAQWGTTVRACKEARVRRFEASSVVFEICRERQPPESHIDHRRAREVRGAREQTMLHSSSSAIELCRAAAPAGVRQSAEHADCTAETIRPRSEHLVARSKQQPRLAARRNPQIERNQVKSSDQKRGRAYPKYVDGAALEWKSLRLDLLEVDRMTALIHYERQRWKKVNFFAKKPLPRSFFQHVQTLCMPSFIDLHTHATPGHVTSFVCSRNTSDRSLAWSRHRRRSTRAIEVKHETLPANRKPHAVACCTSTASRSTGMH